MPTKHSLKRSKVNFLFSWLPSTKHSLKTFVCICMLTISASLKKLRTHYIYIHMWQDVYKIPASKQLPSTWNIILLLYFLTPGINCWEEQSHEKMVISLYNLSSCTITSDRHQGCCTIFQFRSGPGSWRLRSAHLDSRSYTINHHN